ncbi:MAG: leucine-rich repeat protein [Oscillospiraceae bacterium]|nr:leucine-rich repeat protein [Oscillospiraceae bacterium]
MQKRVLSVLLILVMCLSLLPAGVLAAEEAEDEAENVGASEAETEVIEDTGTDGTAEESAEAAETVEETDEAGESAEEETPEAGESAEAETPEAAAGDGENGETGELSPSASAAAEHTEASETISESEEDITTEEAVTEEAETVDSSTVDSGSCGTNVTWTLDSAGVLTISGTGEMTSSPWRTSYADEIKSVVIQSGVTSIAAYAFYGCANMTSVTIPASVTSIGECALAACTSLANITVSGDNTVYSAADGVLFNKSKTELIIYSAKKSGAYTIPSTVTSIGAYAFADCTALTGVTIPSSVTSIGDGAFWNCTGLTDVTIPAKTTYLGGGAFYNCSNLRSVTINGSITSIGNVTFYNCSLLTSVEIPASVTSIGASAFRFCTSLTSVTIPAKVSSIGNYAFASCTSLTSIEVSAGNNYYCSENGVLYNSSKTALISVPGKMSSVNIANTVTSIETGALCGCTLTAVKIPSSVTSIGTNAFLECDYLESVYYAGTTSNWNSITISTGNDDLTAASIQYNYDGSIVGDMDIEQLSITNSGIEITWNADVNAEGYSIYRRLSTSSTYSAIATITDGATDSYVDKNVTSGQTYYYYVCAYVGNFESGYSEKWITYMTNLVTSVSNPSQAASSNAGYQDYYYASSQVSSTLVEMDNGYMRVEYMGSGKIVVEYYDNDYNLLSQKYITGELGIYGGFYAGEDAYYLVYGQTNYDEDDSVEVVRVVKYSTSWERLGQASLYGANTTIPFNAGSCRMYEYNGYLYVRTCHTMYTTSDGLNHQANMTIQIRTADMKITDSAYLVAGSGAGYTSHSFNQFILVDDSGNLIGLDHGDGAPRSAVLIKSETKAGADSFGEDCTYVNVFEFQGDYGNNYTGASLGGLEYSSSSYLVAGNSGAQARNWSSNSTRNIFVTVTSRSNFSESGTTVKWITSYAEGGSVSASTPQLVKLGSDSFLLLWTTTENSATKLNYVYLDGKGNTTTSIYTVNGLLSDCQPIVSGGVVTWYVTSGSAPVFYTIDENGTFSASTLIGDINMDGTVNGRDLIYLRKRLAGNSVTIDEEAADVNQDGNIDGKDLIFLRKILASN